MSVVSKVADVDADADIVMSESDDEHIVTQYSQELQINVDKVSLLLNRRQKVKTLFNVKVTENEQTQEDITKLTKKPTVQWIKLTGTKEDCKDAAEYIRALCNPRVWHEFKYDPGVHSVIAGGDTNTSRIATIEQQTKAALFDDTPGYIFIQGDELTIALAASLLYEAVNENSAVGHESPDHDSSVLDSMLQDKFCNGDLESTTDSNVTRYTEEIKRALLLSVSDTKNPEQLNTINLCENEDGGCSEEISDNEESMDMFLALARSKKYRDEEAKVVISQKGLHMTDAEFIRALSTNRRIGSVPSTKLVSSDETGFRNISGFVVSEKISGSNSSLSSGDSDIIDLRSDTDYDDLHDLPERKIENQPTGDNAAVSNSAERQSKKSRKKKKKAKQVVADAATGKSSSAMDIDMISLMRMGPSNKHVVVIKNSPTAHQQSLSTSGELTSGVMQRVQNRKEKQRMATADNAIRSRSPLKPTAKEPTANHDIPLQFPPYQSTPHQLKLYSEDRFQAANHQGVIRPQVSSTGVKFGAGPKLRYIVIDGSNVAMHHGMGKCFSCRGIQVAVKYFQGRGHPKITAIVPQWRRQTALASKYPIRDMHLLEEMYGEGLLAFTPSRRIGTQNIVPYDDRFILELASQTQGIVVSNDNYRDLYQEKREFKEVIEKRLLPFTLVNDIFIVPEDPLGRNGPNLEQYLSMPSSATVSVPEPVQKFFGNSEAMQPYWGPSPSPRPGTSGWARMPSRNEPSTSSTESWPTPQGIRPMSYTYRPDITNGGFPSRMNPHTRLPHLAMPKQRSASMAPAAGPRHQQRSSPQAQRTREQTDELLVKLCEVFPDNKSEIGLLLKDHPQDTSIEKLSAILIGMLEDSV